MKLVFTNGCFDLLHPGHLDLLERARAFGDRLVVGLNSDRSVRDIKGPGRPFLGQEDRARMLRSLRSVDEVIVFDEPTPARLIEELAPDVLVKGGDWPVEKIVGAAGVLARKGRVISLPFRFDYSTTALARRILGAKGGARGTVREATDGPRLPVVGRQGNAKAVDLAKIKTVVLAERPSKVRSEDFARPPKAGASFSEFLASLPDILAGSDVRAVVGAIVRARRAGRPVILGMGAHVIKCGLGPVVIDLMERGIVTGVAMNGAGPIHDVEIALVGRTSEDVQAGLEEGRFGMAGETALFIAGALREGRAEDGLGQAIGRKLLVSSPPHVGLSILAAAARLDLPATVHVAIGTDIIHMHPEVDAAAIGAASLVDFRRLAGAVMSLSGGVYINAGSSVILPEVFLKALTVAQNLGADLHDFTTVNLDMLGHYRPAVNVVERPSAIGGRGFSLIGRHEILIPLLAFSLVEALAREERPGVSDE